MINLEKNKWKSASPLLLRRSAPVPYFHPFLKFFSPPPPPPGEVIKIYSPLPFKKEGGANYVQTLCFVLR